MHGVTIMSILWIIGTHKRMLTWLRKIWTELLPPLLPMSQRFNNLHNNPLNNQFWAKRRQRLIRLHPATQCLCPRRLLPYLVTCSRLWCSLSCCTQCGRYFFTSKKTWQGWGNLRWVWYRGKLISVGTSTMITSVIPPLDGKHWRNSVRRKRSVSTKTQMWSWRISKLWLRSWLSWSTAFLSLYPTRHSLHLYS